MAKNKLRDAIYGLAIGDALGVPVEFCPRGSFHVEGMTGYGTYNKPAGTWSDDTAMTLATCDSIRENGVVNIDDIRSKFEAWINDGKYAIDGIVFDVGGTTRRALASGMGETDELACGNGSLMRIVPLAFIDDISAGTIGDVSAITHANGFCQDLCSLYVVTARHLKSGIDLRNIQFGELASLIEELDNTDEENIASSGYVYDTFKAALWAILHTDNFKDAVLTAVNLGDDSDTVGAVTGALAGIIYGYDNIPKEWIETLRGKEIIESCLF